MFEWYPGLTLAAQIKDIMEYQRLKYFQRRYRVEPGVLAEVAASKVGEEPETKAGEKEYPKLVRDKIPEIIEADGKKCEIRKLDDEEYLLELNWKLQEEILEYLESGTVEELADVSEVIQAILRLKGVSKKKFEETMAGKRAERGGFEERVYLVRVMR